MNSTESTQLVERTNLITAMVGEDDSEGFTTAATSLTENYKRVRRLLTRIFSREALQDVQRDAHVVLRLKVQRRHKPTNVRSTSEITFIQVNASTNYSKQDSNTTSQVSNMFRSLDARPGGEWNDFGIDEDFVRGLRRRHNIDTTFITKRALSTN